VSIAERPAYSDCEQYGNYSCGPDLELLPLIDHANVACGFHAGDPSIMMETVRNCKKHNIKVGAHPGLPDIQGKCRMSVDRSNIIGRDPWVNLYMLYMN